MARCSRALTFALSKHDAKASPVAFLGLGFNKGRLRHPTGNGEANCRVTSWRVGSRNAGNAAHAAPTVVSKRVAKLLARCLLKGGSSETRTHELGSARNGEHYETCNSSSGFDVEYSRRVC
jgi:hypothetical protein